MSQSGLAGVEGCDRSACVAHKPGNLEVGPDIERAGRRLGDGSGQQDFEIPPAGGQGPVNHGREIGGCPRGIRHAGVGRGPALFEPDFVGGDDLVAQDLEAEIDSLAAFLGNGGRDVHAQKDCLVGAGARQVHLRRRVGDEAAAIGGGGRCADRGAGGDRQVNGEGTGRRRAGNRVLEGLGLDVPDAARKHKLGQGIVGWRGRGRLGCRPWNNG